MDGKQVPAMSHGAGRFAGPFWDGVGILQPGWSLFGTEAGKPGSLAGVSDRGKLRESAERHASWRAGVFDYLHGVPPAFAVDSGRIPELR